MVIDDHVIDNLRGYFNHSYKELKKEWQSNNYEKLSYCPSFKATQAYQDAMRVLIKANDPSFQGKSLEEQISEDLELEEFREI